MNKIKSTINRINTNKHIKYIEMLFLMILALSLTALASFIFILFIVIAFTPIVPEDKPMLILLLIFEAVIILVTYKTYAYVDNSV